MDRERLRQTFDAVAELYDRARPGYPEDAVSDLLRYADLRPGCRVLEIGCGTGILTQALAERGLAVTAVEIGPRMAEVARARLGRFADVSIWVGAFEDFPLPTAPFDLVVSATAFHWVDPAIRVEKSADALRPGGALAILHTHHVAGDPAFFDASQRCYRKYDPEAREDFRMPAPEDIPLAMPEIDASPRLARVSLRRYLWELEYTADAYRDLLLTYSSTQKLGADGVLLAECIRSAIAERHGGTIRKPYLTELRIAKTRDSS